VTLPTISITLPGPAPAGLADDLADDLGVYPEIDTTERGPDASTGYVVVGTALTMLTSGMLEQFGVEAANRLMTALARLRRPVAGPPHEVRLVDEANDVVVVFDEAAVKDRRAVEALLTLERDVYRRGVELRWHGEVGRWRARR
jgi:hypothetical protein